MDMSRKFKAARGFVQVSEVDHILGCISTRLLPHYELNETFDVVCIKVMSKKRAKIVEDVDVSTSERRQRNGQKTTEVRFGSSGSD